MNQEKETSCEEFKCDKEDVRGVTGGLLSHDELAPQKNDKKRLNSEAPVDRSYTPIELPEVP